jgi:hypothetical protein
MVVFPMFSLMGEGALMTETLGSDMKKLVGLDIFSP